MLCGLRSVSTKALAEGSFSQSECRSLFRLLLCIEQQEEHLRLLLSNLATGKVRKQFTSVHK